MDTEANQLEEQSEFRAAELSRLRSDALQAQIVVKLALAADLCGLVEERPKTSVLAALLEKVQLGRGQLTSTIVLIISCVFCLCACGCVPQKACSIVVSVSSASAKLPHLQNKRGGPQTKVGIKGWLRLLDRQLREHLLLSV